MELLVLGLSYQTAPLALREKLALVTTELTDQLKALQAAPGVREVALLSTCNRVEAYVATPDPDAALDAVAGLFANRLQSEDEAATLPEHLYKRVGKEAVRHLFRVTASLDSLVVGESQILGQVKDAYELAAQAGTVGAFLGSCFPRAFRIARRVRRETEIARQTTSISSVAVECARRVFDGFAGVRVLLVGAGKMSDLAARALRAQGAQVVVTNRTLARAQELAERLGCAVRPFEELEPALAQADIVITSTGAREPVIGRALLKRVQRSRRGKQMVIVDIAVPRDVEPGAGALDGVFLYDIDDLQKIASEHLDGRRAEATRAEDLIESEVGRFFEAQRGRALGPTISALRSRFAAVASAEAARVLAANPALDERSRREVARMADAIVGKLLHTPQVVLKRAAAGEDGDALVLAAQQLFELAVPVELEPEIADGEAPVPALGPVAEADETGGATPAPATGSKKLGSLG